MYALGFYSSTATILYPILLYRVVTFFVCSEGSRYPLNQYGSHFQ